MRSCRRVAEDVRVRTEKHPSPQELFEPTSLLERDDARHVRLRMLLQDSDPAMPPVDVLVLDLHHLATPTASVQGADEAIAHLVAHCELRVWIPDVAADDLIAERSRDVELLGDVALLDSLVRERPDLADLVPREASRGANRFVQKLAGIEQTLLFHF